MVEDEAIVAMALESSLKRIGHDVVATVATGEDAVELVGTTHVDIILMDIQLAGDMTGIQAAERIHAEHDIPIIFLSAFSDDATIQQAKLTQPYGYLVKPYDDRELRAALEIALHNARVWQDRIASTDALRDRERVLQDALDASGVVVYMKDALGRFTMMNRSFEAAFGVDRIRARGRPDEDVLPAEVARTLSHADEDAMRAPNGTRAVQTLRLPEGERTFSTQRFPVRDAHGVVTGICAVLTDISMEGAEAETISSIESLLGARVDKDEK